MAAITFFLARGMVRTEVEQSLQGPTCSEGELWEQRGCRTSLGAAPWWKQGKGVCVCVCAGVGARQGGVPDPSTLPSELMQLRSKIHLSYS